MYLALGNISVTKPVDARVAGHIPTDISFGVCDLRLLRLQIRNTTNSD